MDVAILATQNIKAKLKKQQAEGGGIIVTWYYGQNYAQYRYCLQQIQFPFNSTKDEWTWVSAEPNLLYCGCFWFKLRPALRFGKARDKGHIESFPNKVCIFPSIGISLMYPQQRGNCFSIVVHCGGRADTGQERHMRVFLSSLKYINFPPYT